MNRLELLKSIENLGFTYSRLLIEETYKLYDSNIEYSLYIGDDKILTFIITYNYLLHDIVVNINGATDNISHEEFLGLLKIKMRDGKINNLISKIN